MKLAAMIDLAFARRRRGEDCGGAQIARIEGHCLRFRVTGRGPLTLVLVPDPPNVIEHYDALMTRLAGCDFRVVCLDLPGFGGSRPAWRFDFSFEAYDRVIGLFLQRLGLGPYVLCFPCLSAHLAQRMRRSWPRLIRDVVMIQATPWTQQRAWMERVDRRRICRRKLLGQLTVRALRRQLVDGWYGACLGNPEHRSTYATIAHETLCRHGRFCLASTFQSAWAELHVAPGDGRSLVVWGDQDRTHRQIGRDVEAFPSDHRKVRLIGAGHFPEIENPGDFVDAVTSYLRDHASSAARAFR